MDLASSIEILEARIAPATFTVSVLDDSGPGSLRQAVLDSNHSTHPGADTIVFTVHPNVIKLTSGEILIDDPLKIIGPGGNKIIIDGNNASRIFNITDGSAGTDSPVSISGLVLIHGNTAGNGGAIYDTESLTIKNCVISGNTSGSAGGGVEAYASDTPHSIIKVTNSLISNNHSGTGGGMRLGAAKSVTLSNCQILDNVATGTRGGGVSIGIPSGLGFVKNNIITGNTAKYGGGLFVTDSNPDPSSKITISGSTITGNISTDSGGGVYAGAGNLIVSSSTLSNNVATNAGGGIASIGFTTLSIVSSKITGNRTTDMPGGIAFAGGGGVRLTGPGTARITSSTISDNTAASYGGGIAAFDGTTLNLLRSTISGNNSLQGGGIIAYGFGTSEVTLKITGGEISGNSCPEPSGLGGGGGIFVDSSGDVTITGARLSHNTADNGGGAFIRTSGNVALTGVSFTHNAATADAGGLYIQSTPNLKITGGSFIGNTAVNGGGIFENGVNGGIFGTKIFGNAATDTGGGVFDDTASTSHLLVDLSKVIGNIAVTDPNVHGTTF
ncbi:MAG: hypothetical protein QOD99_1024 [Chthoniobacter sp.]|jgi:predicted outer membrane repeat protein|nr:hypothetical protein [Chthoniobacter sp.]